MTHLNDSIDSSHFYMRLNLPLTRKDSVTSILGLADYVKKRLPFSRDLSFENSEDSYLCFKQVVLHSISYFIFLY